MESINYIGLIPYFYVLILYLMSSLISYLYRKKLFFIIALIPPILLVVLKDIISPDFFRYTITYENIEDFSYLTFEPFFILTSYIFNYLGLNYYIYFSFYAFLTIILIIFGIAFSTQRIAFAFLLFMLTPGFYLNMFVEMRQVLAISFVFLIVSLIVKIKHNKKAKYILYVLLLFSFVFHYSSLLFTLLFFSLKRKLEKVYPLIFYITFPIFILIGVILFRLDILIQQFVLNIIYILAPFFGFLNKYSYYLEYAISGSIEQVHGQILKNIFYTANLMILSYIITKSKHLKNRSSIIIYLNLYFIGVIILNFFYYNAVLTRLCYYFFIFSIVLIPEIIFGIKNRYYRYLFLFSYLIIYFLMFIKGLFYYSDEAEEYIFLHYKTFLGEL